MKIFTAFSRNILNQRYWRFSSRVSLDWW